MHAGAPPPAPAAAMSFGYADKLKRKKNVGGQLGATEYFDSVDDVVKKMKHVAGLVRALSRMSCGL
eukprot:150361-Chlamydomonas_euryale.AAC.1